MPGIPSTLGHILHSSTATAPSSIDFNFFTNTTLFAFLINFIWMFPLSCSPLISRLLSLKLSLRQSAYKFRRRISNSKLLNNQTFLSKVLLKMKAKSFTKKGFLFKTEINSLETIRGGQFNNGVDILTKEALCITPKIFWCDFD